MTSIKNEYLAIPKGNGKRNSGFYICGLKLSNYLSLAKLEIELNNLARREDKIVNRVPGVISSIKKKKGVNYQLLKAA